MVADGATSQGEPPKPISSDDESPGDLEERLASWRQEQLKVASRVVVLDDHDELSKCTSIVSSRYKCLTSTRETNDTPGDEGPKYYGGVDVSFPDNKENPAVAYYVIIAQDKDGALNVSYEDHEEFILTVPYVSSYLSFREIDPLVRLVEKQRRCVPELTPSAILVDGNGILHTRKAGIACFLGVRTNIPTIGVGKTLYCHDGLTKDGVLHCVRARLGEFIHEYRRSIIQKPHHHQGVISDETEAVQAREKKEAVVIMDTRVIFGSEPIIDESDVEASAELSEYDALLNELSPLSSGFGLLLKGKTGTVWGCALVGHGGKLTQGRGVCRGTKNPIFISVGHNISLSDAVRICAELSFARIPEPVRQADLAGRDLLRSLES